MKNALLILFYIVLSAFSSSTNRQSDPSGFGFRVKEVASGTSLENVKLKLEFTNTTIGPLRLFTVFEPLGVFFSMTLADEKGVTYHLLRGGKADIPFNLRSYSTLKPGENYQKEISLAEILKANHLKLARGVSRLKMAYHNQYGENCVKGQFESNQLSLKL